MPEKDLYNLSCSNAFLNTLIISNVEGERTERGLQTTGWGDACHGCVLADGIYSGREAAQSALEKWKASVSLGPGSTCFMGLGE